MPEHKTLSGQIIEYPEPEPALAAIVRKLTRMAKDPDATEADMIKVAYSDRNSLLGPNIVPGRGSVTSETLLSPVWHVIQDLLAQKQVEEDGLDKDDIAAQYTVPVAEAAKELGISTSGAQQAVTKFRLPVWIKNGQYFASPRGIAMYKIGKSGPRPRSRPGPKKQATPPLSIRVGSAPGISFRIHLVGGKLEEKKKAGPDITEAIVPKWRQLGLIVGKTKDRNYRFVSYVPREPIGDPDEYKVDDFFIRGYFQQVEEEVENNSIDAHKAFENFRMEHPKK